VRSSGNCGTLKTQRNRDDRHLQQPAGQAGAAEQVVSRFAESRGHVQDFPGFISMEVLRSDGAAEMLVITRWENREALYSWVASDGFCTSSTLVVPRLTVTAVK
jgi:quinol monooxygenase YgiN